MTRIHYTLAAYRQYLDTLFWTAQIPREGTPPVENPFEARRDVVGFIRTHWELVNIRSPEKTGYDLALTRNYEGAGFWDGSWPDREGEILTAAAHKLGPQSIHVADDGVIFLITE